MRSKELVGSHHSSISASGTVRLSNPTGLVKCAWEKIQRVFVLHKIARSNSNMVKFFKPWSYWRLLPIVFFRNHKISGSANKFVWLYIILVIIKRKNRYYFSIYGVKSFEHIHSDDIYIDKRDKKGIGLC